MEQMACCGGLGGSFSGFSALWSKKCALFPSLGFLGCWGPLAHPGPR